MYHAAAYGLAAGATVAAGKVIGDRYHWPLPGNDVQVQVLTGVHPAHKRRLRPLLEYRPRDWSYHWLHSDWASHRRHGAYMRLPRSLVPHAVPCVAQAL